MMTGFESYRKKTRRVAFLEEMEQVVPWRKLCALVNLFMGPQETAAPGDVGVGVLLREAANPPPSSLLPAYAKSLIARHELRPILHTRRWRLRCVVDEDRKSSTRL